MALLSRHLVALASSLWNSLSWHGPCQLTSHSISLFPRHAAMFVPRQVQKARVAGHPNPLPPKPSVLSSHQSVVEQPKHATGSNYTKPGTIDLHTAQAIVLALEQLFSSLNPWTQWLDDCHREADGKNDCLFIPRPPKSQPARRSADLYGTQMYTLPR